MGKRIIPQRRGRGGPRYTSPSHRHIGRTWYPDMKEGSGTVIDIVHAPGRSAPLIKVTYGSEKVLLPAPEGIRKGQNVMVGKNAEIESGNIMALSQIPEGTLVHNVEIRPGEGGRIARAGGTAAIVLSQGAKTVIELPSGGLKHLNPRCKATIGIIAGTGRGEKPYTKSGKKFHAMRSRSNAYFKVKGIAMNSVNHPHGGGGHPHVGTPSTVSRNAPPGRKVGNLSPQKKSKKGR